MNSLVLAAIVGPTLDWVAGVLIAVGVILGAYKKLISPIAKGITTFNEDVAPNVRYLPDLAKLDPMLTVLESMAAEFRTNSGSSLRDSTNRLEEQADAARQAAEKALSTAIEFARLNRESITALEVAMGTVRELAKEDRQLAREDRDRARDALERMVALADSMDRTEASGARIEADRAHVAKDLAATQQRADDVLEHEPPGSAADAASQSPDTG